MSNKFGKIDCTELEACAKRWTRFVCKDFKLFRIYLENKDAYIIHYFSSPDRYRRTDGDGNRHIFPSNYLIDNYGNIYNVAQSSNRIGNFYSEEKFLCMPKPEYTNGPHNNQDGQNHTFDVMHPYILFENKLSNKSIKIIKLINMCEENEMVNLIKNLLEDKEEDIHFMKNKNKELEDTNKDLLLKMEEMKEKHNELVNKLMDRIIDLTPKN